MQAVARGDPGCQGQGATDAAGAVLVAASRRIQGWLEGQRTLLGKLIVDGNIKLG